MSDESDQFDLKGILFKRGGQFRLAFCRGKKRGCERNPEHRSTPCDFCIIPNENETLGEVLERLDRGDA